jgi:hypothetical protein
MLRAIAIDVPAIRAVQPAIVAVLEGRYGRVELR